MNPLAWFSVAYYACPTLQKLSLNPSGVNPLHAGKMWPTSFVVTSCGYFSATTKCNNNKNRDNSTANIVIKIILYYCGCERTYRCHQTLQQFIYTVSWAAYLVEVTFQIYWLSIDKISPLLNQRCIKPSYFGYFRGLKASVTTTWK